MYDSGLHAVLSGDKPRVLVFGGMRAGQQPRDLVLQLAALGAETTLCDLDALQQDRVLTAAFCEGRLSAAVQRAEAVVLWNSRQTASMQRDLRQIARMAAFCGVPVIARGTEENLCGGVYRNLSALVVHAADLVPGLQSPTSTESVAARICQQYSIDSLLTLNESAVTLYRPPLAPRVFPTAAAGAEPAVFAAVTVGWAHGLSPVESCQLAVQTVQALSEISDRPVTLETLRISWSRRPRTGTAKLVDATEMKQVRSAQGSRLRLVLLDDAFDELPPEHVSALRQAAAFGECVVALLETDREFQCGRADGRTSDPQRRAQSAAALDFVDYVMTCDEPRETVLSELRPTTFVQASGRAVNAAQRRLIESFGGSVHVLDVPAKVAAGGDIDGTDVLPWQPSDDSHRNAA